MRQFISSQNVDKNGRLVVSGKDFRYLSSVLRLNISDVIQVRFPNGQLCQMIVEKIQAKQLYLIKTVEIKDDNLNEVKNDSCEFWLFQFIPKVSKMDTIVRQAVECGVSVIIPVVGEFSASGSKDIHKDRWERIIREARQQSGSPIATRIEEPLTIEKALDLWNSRKTSCCAVALYEKNEKTVGLHKLFAQRQDKPKQIALAVGCEGGISENEIQQLQDSGFSVIHFDTNILRCETAAIYGLAILQNLIMEFTEWHIQE